VAENGRVIESRRLTEEAQSKASFPLKRPVTGRGVAPQPPEQSSDMAFEVDLGEDHAPRQGDALVDGRLGARDGRISPHCRDGNDDHDRPAHREFPSDRNLTADYANSTARPVAGTKVD